jgi:hypothetical protein
VTTPADGPVPERVQLRIEPGREYGCAAACAEAVHAPADHHDGPVSGFPPAIA